MGERVVKRSLMISTVAIVATLAVGQARAEDRESSSAGEAAQEDSASSKKGSGVRVRFGGMAIGAGYSHFSGYSPYWFPYYYRPLGGPGWDPFWGYGWGSWLHPGYYAGFRQGPGMGVVKVKASSKQALVYVDGAYAGVLKDLGNMWLEPGAYDIEVREDGASFQQRIYVLSGKTVRVSAELAPPEGNQP